MREALDGRREMPPFRPADQATNAEQRLGWVSAPTTTTAVHPPHRQWQATDLAVAAQRVRDCLDRLTPPPAEHDPLTRHDAKWADEQAATDEH
ncbi:MAG: hypothetical protein GEV12_00685 [Micromonosporaceae bacterium]|nr:hypothetical protein [Micromonosporaceae bacterium]